MTGNYVVNFEKVTAISRLFPAIFCLYNPLNSQFPRTIFQPFLPLALNIFLGWQHNYTVMKHTLRLWIKFFFILSL